MKANKLIGRLAIRTKPVSYGRNNFTGEENRDYSYTSEPIHILKVTDNHIVYDYNGTNNEIFEGKHILNNRWLDDNWIDYEKLMKNDNEKS